MIELNKVEDEIIILLVTQLLKDGYMISVNDGEETTVLNSTDINVIINALKTTDEDYLICIKAGAGGTVTLIYGNSEWEVICDYTTSLESSISDAIEFADKACDFYE